jgi:hypothetical protein
VSHVNAVAHCVKRADRAAVAVPAVLICHSSKAKDSGIHSLKRIEHAYVVTVKCIAHAYVFAS